MKEFKLFALNEIFNIIIGKSIDLNKLLHSPDGINYVGRTEENNGVTAKVIPLENVTIYKGNSITIPMVGHSTLKCSYQKEPFCVSQNIAILTLKDFTLNEYIAFYIIANLRREAYRFSYGRTLSLERMEKLKIRLPANDNLPDWKNMEKFCEDLSLKNRISDFKIDSTPIIKQKVDFPDRKWRWFVYNELFDIERGRGTRIKDLEENGDIPFITSIDQNNGLAGFTNTEPVHNGNVIGVNRNGSVGEAFYQPTPFCSTEDVHIFNPKFELNPYIAMFLVTLIRKEKYRFSYGRKWGIGRMQESKIKLPVDENNNPDWNFMENYIKSLPYSSKLADN